MELDLKQLGIVIRSIAEEKNLSEDAVKEVIEQALAAAYRRDFGERDQEVRVSLNLNTGDMEVVTIKTVVDVVENNAVEMTLDEAKKINLKAKVGEEVEIPGQADKFGRVAAQTAKQVIMQRLREAEREIIMDVYQDKIGTVVNAIVGRVEGRMVRVELDKAQAIMPASEQIQGERYHPGQRLKVYIKDIERSGRGPQLLVSRGCPEFIEWLFRGEVPEMESGAVSIKAISREAGVRTKLAVTSSVPGVDAVGTFVGGRGSRVNAVMSEIGDGEKIDIIVWDDETEQFIKNALSPTETISVIVDQANKKAIVRVAEDQLSIAIGKGGQNVRLASKLSGYEIDIVSDNVEANTTEEAEVTTSKPLGGQKLKRKDQLESSLLSAIEEHGEDTEEKA
ncbi:transcription termination factor NusA [Candidatus Saccharibacteria bacterium RIFCSPHIGHO2_12_FULL_41_12]|nr:MAG: transcription termination factor NusA [Candidatus Saccharibacteria bacterium RIFCSPHIGHO2_12_FULL_41_12]